MRSSSAFWDSSAIVPLCVNQAASHQAHGLFRKFALVVWWGSYIEVHSALCRLHRQKEISDLAKRGAPARLRLLSRGWREVLPNEQVRDLAIRSLESNALRAADSLQLAASLVWCSEHPSKRTFICADGRLAQAASSAGFSVIQFLPTTP